MNRQILVALFVLALFPGWSSAQSDASSPAVEGDVHAVPVDFAAQHCWVFSEDLAKADGLPDLEGVQSTDGTRTFSSSDFVPSAFDPRDWRIVYSENPAKPTNLRIGGRGVIQFHSVERCRVLNERHRIQAAKAQH